MSLPETRILNPETLQNERERFPLWIPVMLGTGMGVYFALDNEPQTPLSAGVLFAACFAVYGLRRWFLPRLIAIAFTLAAAGFLLAAIRTNMVETPVIYGELFFRDVVGRIDDIQVKEKGRKVMISEPVIEGLPENRNPKRISVTLKKDDPSLKIGDKVQLKAMLFAPPSPAMPQSYDFTRALYFERIGAVGFSTMPPVILERGEPNRFEESLNALRLSLAERIVKPMRPENGPVATAMMVGEQSAVSKEVADSMRDSGIYHVLSISGLHMTLAAGMLYFMARLLLALYPPLSLRLPAKKIAAGIGLAGAFAYLLLAGYPVPAVRSFVMVACVMLAVMFDRRGISLYSLAWAAVIVLLWQPESIFGASFQLSFAATLAILALYEKFSPALFNFNARILYKVWLYFFGLIATSLAATLVTTPLVIYHFNRFTVWGIVANMLMVPLASFWIMPAAVIALIAMPFGLEYYPLLFLDYGIGLMLQGSNFISSLPAAAFSVPSPTTWGIVLVVFGALWLCLWQRRWRLYSIPLIFIGMSTIALHKPYDMLISDDGTKVAMRRDDNKWLFIRGTPDSFDGGIWLRANGQEDGLTLADIKSESDAPKCDDNKCLLEINGHKIAIGKSKKRIDGLCDEKADILVSDAYLSAGECKNIPYLFDKRFLANNGAVGLHFHEKGIEVDTADMHRGNRPWVSRRNSSLYQPEKPDITNP